MGKSKCPLFTLCLALLFAAAVSSEARADEWDHATKLTFSEPVEIPGSVLDAGTYWFTLADSQSDRNIVQIWNADRTQLVTTVLAIPDYRLHPTGDTVIKFDERPSGSPEAIHAWFYPGDNFGQEFVYPKTRATELAKQVSQPVLSVRDDNPPEQLKQATVKAVNPSGEEIEVAEVVVSQPVAQQPMGQSLPQTASSLPLILALGLLSLAGAVALRVIVQKRAWSNC